MGTTICSLRLIFGGQWPYKSTASISWILPELLVIKLQTSNVTMRSLRILSDATVFWDKKYVFGRVKVFDMSDRALGMPFWFYRQDIRKLHESILDASDSDTIAWC